MDSDRSWASLWCGAEISAIERGDEDRPVSARHIEGILKALEIDAVHMFAMLDQVARRLLAERRGRKAQSSVAASDGSLKPR
jgi:hypothetical protein